MGRFSTGSKPEDLPLTTIIDAFGRKAWNVSCHPQDNLYFYSLIFPNAYTTAYMRKNTIIVAALLYCSFTQAQEDTTKSLNEVVVTANKFPQKQNTTGKVITVVTQQQIQRSIGKDLAQLLNEQTGMIVNGAYSSPGKDKGIFLRGASSGYTLLLLDGVPLNDPSGVGGSYDIRLIPLEQIERIEILKGSQSTLYGSNAIAGVINIITKKGESNQLQGNGTLTFGSYDSFRGNASINRKTKWIDYNLNYEYNKSKGISEAKDTTGSAAFDKDGFNRQAFQANIGVNLSDNFKLTPYYRYAEFEGGYDAGSFKDAPSKYKTSLLNTGLLGKLAYTNGSLQFNYAYDDTKRQYDAFLLNGKFHNGDVYVNHRLSSFLQLLGGLNYQNYRLPDVKKEFSITSPYASLLFNLNGLNVELGSRFNYHTEAGNKFNYSFTPSYLINNAIKIFGSISTGFKAPSVGELYGPFGANLDLKPEESRNLEGGIQAWAADRKLSVLATYFERHLKNAIAYDFSAGYINRDKQNDYGVEAEANYQWNNKWNFRASYTFVDGETTQKTFAGKDTSFHNLIRRPKHTVNVFAGYQITKNFFVSTSLQSFSKRKDLYTNPNTFTSSPVRLKAFALWNAYAEYSIANSSVKFFIDAKNLTNNKDYYEVYGYSVQGTTVNGGIRFKF